MTDERPPEDRADDGDRGDGGGRFVLPTLASWDRDERRGGLALRTGVDIASCTRVGDLTDSAGFLAYVFTEGERAYCESKADPAPHYAARWAAKEAFLKVLDEDDPALDLTTVEVVREGRRPTLALAPPARERLADSVAAAGGDLSGAAWDVSLSHDDTIAAAMAAVVLVFDVSAGPSA